MSLRRAGALVLLLVAATASACSDDGESASRTTSTSATSAGAAGSTTPTTAAGTTASPTCPGSSGTSPATFDGDGRYAVYVAAFDAEEQHITFDVFQWLSGDDAVRAYREENPDDPEGTPPNDYMTRNDSERLRTLPVADGAAFFVVYDADGRVVSVQPQPVDASAYAQRLPAREVPAWLLVRDGEVVEVCEQYRP